MLLLKFGNIGQWYSRTTFTTINREYIN